MTFEDLKNTLRKRLAPGHAENKALNIQGDHPIWARCVSRSVFETAELLLRRFPDVDHLLGLIRRQEYSLKQNSKEAEFWQEVWGYINVKTNPVPVIPGDYSRMIPDIREDGKQPFPYGCPPFLCATTTVTMAETRALPAPSNTLPPEKEQLMLPSDEPDDF